jgi:Flp pilus assembly CpaE family ATPase
MTERVRPSRRSTDVGPADSPKERIRRLVKHIAADPVLAAWLADSKARTIGRLAADLSAAGYKEAADLAHQFANGLRHGGISPF